MRAKTVTSAASASRQTAVQNDFRLSRIQAEGWNAALRLPTIASDKADTAQIQALNPYSTDSERARWMEGFMDALKR